MKRKLAVGNCPGVDADVDLGPGVSIKTLNQEFEQLFGENAVPTDGVVLTKGYDNTLAWAVDVDEVEVVGNLLGRARFNAIEKTAVGTPESLEDLTAKLNEIERTEKGFRSRQT